MTKAKNTVSRPSRTAKVPFPPSPKYFFHNAKMVLAKIPAYQPVSSVSVTEPNQVQSLSTILQQRARGIMPSFFNGAYSDYETEDVQKMDFIELRDYRDRIAERSKQLANEYKALTNQMEQVRAQALEERLDTLIKQKTEVSASTSNSAP